MLVKEILFFFEDVTKLDLPQNSIKNNIIDLLESEKKIAGTLSIVFCSDNYLLKINNEYLNHNYYTDVITFSYNKENQVNGDLFISTERIRENAKTYGVSFVEELTRVIFHGILHLAGYNDQTQEEKTIMRMKENFYLEQVKFTKFPND